VKIDRVGSFIFSEKFGTSLGYVENGTTFFRGGGGGSSERESGVSGNGTYGGTNGELDAIGINITSLRSTGSRF